MPTEPLGEIIKEINNSHKTLYVLCGLPYSGKTYLSREILAKTSCVYVSIDDILRELGFDWDSNELPDKDGWKNVFDISYHRSQEALKDGSNVIYDSTNHTKASRDELRKIAQDVGSDFKVIYVDVPVEVVWKRWEENRGKKDRPIVNRELVEMTIRLFEAPTEDENLLINSS